jgi:hypothetical protein
MNFKGQLGSGSQKMCDLFTEFMERTYANEPWVPSDPGPDDVRYELSRGQMHVDLFRDTGDNVEINNINSFWMYINFPSNLLTSG